MSTTPLLEPRIPLRSVRKVAPTERPDTPIPRGRITWLNTVPFIGMHLMCLGAFWVGVSPVAIWTGVALYFFRMFAITGFYHRYFSHRTYQTNRFWQFLFAVAGNACVEKGPLWWAAHHRWHHKHSDEDVDLHSPFWLGFLYAHMGWFNTAENGYTKIDDIKDFARYPELRFLDKFHTLVPALLAGAVFGVGVWLEKAHPEMHTSGMQMLIWGFFVSTIVLYHVTYMVNSLAHRVGSQRYETGDHSRNNLVLALITLGEGWHNNHHHYQASTRQGFYWYEVDISWYILKVMSWLGIIWDMKEPPVHIRDHVGRLDGK